MTDEEMRKAIDEFVLKRVNRCSVHESESVEEAYDYLYESVESLRDNLNPDQEELLSDCEDAYSIMEGEIMNCYYRAGFSDAVKFLLSWGNRSE